MVVGLQQLARRPRVVVTSCTQISLIDSTLDRISSLMNLPKSVVSQKMTTNTNSDDPNSSMSNIPIAADEIPSQPPNSSVYPEPFRARMVGRTKHKLGDYFGLQNFGVNLTKLEPGAISALKHSHENQDEFIYILKGQITLRLGSRTSSSNYSSIDNDNNGHCQDEREFVLREGDCMGFPCSSSLRNNSNNSETSSSSVAHQLINLTDTPAVYLEVGDRTPDSVTYPEDDLCAVGGTRNDDGSLSPWIFTHKDGRPY